MTVNLRSTSDGALWLRAAPLNAAEAIPSHDALDPLFASQLSFSVLSGLPLQHYRPIEEQDLAPISELVELATFETLESFCRATVVRHEEIQQAIDAAHTKFALTRPSYSHPLIRYLRDHYLWLWYERACLLRHLAQPNPERADIVFWRAGPINIASLAMKTEGGKLLIAGPLLLHSPTEIRVDVKTALLPLVTQIGSAWRDSNAANRAQMLFPPSVLVRAASSRFKPQSSNVRARISSIAPLIFALESYLENHGTNMSFAAVTHLAAGLSCIAFDRSYDPSAPRSLDLKVSGAGTPQHGTLRVSVSETGTYSIGTAVPQEAQTSPRLAQLYERALETGAAQWRNAAYESLSIARNWVNSHFGVDQTISSMTLGDLDATVGRRLARFFAMSFVANDASIYRVEYSSPDLALKLFGNFSDDHDALSKQHLLSKHMVEIAKFPEMRSNSIAYRCCDKNGQDYVAGWNNLTSDRPGSPNGMSLPEQAEWTRWGVSAVAVPIRVNGVVWGVLELISKRPDNFTNLIRGEIEEAASILSPFFFVNSVLAIMQEVTEAVLKDEMSVSEKAAHIAGILNSYFLCSDCALLTAGKDDDGNNVLIELARAGFNEELPDVNGSDITAQQLRDGILEFSRSHGAFQTFDGSEAVAQHFGRELSASLSKHPDATLCLLQVPQVGRQQQKVGVLVARFPFPLAPEFGWQRTYMTLATYMFSMLDLLAAEISWGREWRPRFAHQLSQHALSLKTAVQKLKRQRNFEESGYLALSDIESAFEQIELYVDALRELPNDLRGKVDPRVAAIQKKLSKDELRISVVDLRDLYNNATHSRDFASRNILVAQLTEAGATKVRAPSAVLYDVFGILADNALKYTVPGGVIRGIVLADGGGIQLKLINIGPSLSEEEEARIFDDRFRGRFARQKFPKRGSGLGLSYARQALGLFGITIDYEQQEAAAGWKMEGESKISSHIFTIIFPRSLVLK